MAEYTQADLDAVDAAILKFLLGTRTGLVTIGDHTVRYADITLEGLRAARADIAAQVGATAGTYHPRAYASNGGRG